MKLISFALTLTIIGSPTFEDRVQDALDLLDPASVEIVSNLTTIREVDTNTFVWCDGELWLGPATWKREPLWLASGLVHEGTHVAEPDCSVSQEHEFAATLAQREALHRMGHTGPLYNYLTKLLFCINDGGCRWWEGQGALPPDPQIIMPRMP